jgi:hypothetical protein
LSYEVLRAVLYHAQDYFIIPATLCFAQL